MRFTPSLDMRNRFGVNLFNPIIYCKLTKLRYNVRVSEVEFIERSDSNVL